MMRLVTILNIFILLSIFSACGGDQQVDVTEYTAPITNGTIDNSHQAVAYLEISSSQGAFACTATLIGKTTLLSAAHCLLDEDGNVDVKAITAYFGNTPYVATSWVAHPDYNHGGSDVAIIKLAQEPAGIIPYALYSQAPVVNQEITIVGYGITADNLSDSGTKRVAKNLVVGVDDIDINYKGTGSGYGSICSGDSGGPSFIEVNGQEIVVGVHSYGLGKYCGEDEYDSRVDVVIPWIKQFDSSISVFESATDAQDMIPPVVQFITPAANIVTQQNQIIVELNATDDRAVKEVTLYLDGTPIVTSSHAPYRFDINLSVGRHRFTALAIDYAGNQGQNTIQITYQDEMSTTDDLINPEYQDQLLIGGCQLNADADHSYLIFLFLISLFLIKKKR